MGWTPPHLIGINVPDWKRYPPVNSEKESKMKIIRVGVDLAKNVFQVHGVDRSEKPVWRRKLSRASWQDAARDARARLRDRHGGVCRCAPLGAPVAAGGIRGEAYRAPVCEALCEEQQE